MQRLKRILEAEKVVPYDVDGKQIGKGDILVAVTDYASDLKKGAEIRIIRIDSYLAKGTGNKSDDLSYVDAVHGNNDVMLSFASLKKYFKKK